MRDTTIEHPDSLGAMVGHAWEAYHAADWPESFARWERVRASYPAYAPPYIHGGNSLRQAGQLDEALEKLKRGYELFPDHPQLVTSIAACLDEMGQYAQLSEWMEDQIPRFPDNPEVAIDYVRMAHVRHDHRSVIRGEEMLRRVHPGRIEADNGLRHMTSNARLHHEMSRMDSLIAEDVAAAPCNDAAAAADLLDANELMSAFESLGENCEFGLVQRHFGIEPLGLLRWAATSVYSLTLALDETFEGVGVAEHTRLHRSGDEYAVAHARYGMGSHTFIRVDDKNEDAVFRKMVTRLGFLRKKLIEDLEAGEKIFVYSCETGTTERELQAFHQALRRYGSRYLLFVVKSDDQNRPGTVSYAGDGLMIGYNDRLGPERLPTGHVWNISFDHWLGICRAAHDLRRQERAAGVAATARPVVHDPLPAAAHPAAALAEPTPSPVAPPPAEPPPVDGFVLRKPLDGDAAAVRRPPPARQPSMQRRFLNLMGRLGGRDA